MLAQFDITAPFDFNLQLSIVFFHTLSLCVRIFPLPFRQKRRRYKRGRIASRSVRPVSHLSQYPYELFSHHCSSMHVHPLKDSCRLLHGVVRIVGTSSYYIALSVCGRNRTASWWGFYFLRENSAVHLQVDPEEACERRCGVSIPNKPKYLITSMQCGRWNITIIYNDLVTPNNLRWQQTSES